MNNSINSEANNFLKEANLALSKQEYEKAIEHYYKAIDLNPECYVFRLVIGDAYMKISQYEKAIKEYELLLEFIPTHDQALTSMGSCYLMLQNRDMALQSYEKAIEINQEDSDYAYYHAAMLYALRNDDRKANAYLLKAINISDEWRLRAKTNVLLGKYLD